MKPVYIVLIALTLFSCSKPTDATDDASIQGTWIFTHEVSTTMWNWSAAHDSIIINFDQAGRYRYSQYSNYPVDRGSYSVNGNGLVLNSDTAYSSFFAFTHNMLYGSSSTPDEGQTYINDKYIFWKIDNDHLAIERQWLLSSTSTSVSKSAFYFKRQP